MLCLQPLDCITLAGARQQDMPTSLGSNESPHSQPGSHASAQSDCLTSLPAYASWLQQHSDRFHASALQAALIPTPLGQPVDTDTPGVPHSCLSLAEQQHVFMQGVHAGMQLNSLNAADVQASSPGNGSSPSSWSNLQPGGESPCWYAKSVFDRFQPGLSPAGLPLPPQYLPSALSRQIGASLACVTSQPVQLGAVSSSAIGRTPVTIQTNI